MPKLILFAVCEKVLFDQDSKTASLIGLVEKLRVDVPAEHKGPLKGIFLPMTALGYFLWVRDPQDAASKHDQLMEIFFPSGKLALRSSIISFEFSDDKEGVKHGVKMAQFPVDEEGLYDVRVSVREAGAANWIACGNYPIKVVHNRATVKTPEDAQPTTNPKKGVRHAKAKR